MGHKDVALFLLIRKIDSFIAFIFSGKRDAKQKLCESDFKWFNIITTNEEG